MLRPLEYIQQRKRLVRLVLPILVLWGLACGPCDLLSRQVPTPPERVVVSTEAAGQLESRIEQNLSGEPGKQFILQMTDTEVTSLLATELEKYGDSPIRDPKVWFTNGKVYGTGRLVNVMPIETKFYVVATTHIRDDKVVVEIGEISAGTLPLPNSVLEMISQSINETVEDLQLDVDVTALEILEGEAIVQGRRK